MVAVALVVLAAGAMIGWPIYLDARGTATPGVIIEKRETVRTEYGEWFRHFEVTAAYSVPGQPVQHRAMCDVDEKTYDSLHKGNTVVVHYFRDLLSQPFLPATRLSPCTTMAAISLNPSSARNLVVSFVALLVILLLWKMRIRFTAWLFLLWLGLAFALLVLPKTEPEPQQPVAATATIDRIDTIDTLGQGANSEGIPLLRPYQVVLLKFVPPGMDTPVTAIDKIDEDSVPDLKEGQSVAIVYDAAHPRIASLKEGTRRFPMQALTTVVLCCFGLIIIGAAGVAIRRLFRPIP